MLLLVVSVLWSVEATLIDGLDLSPLRGSRLTEDSIEWTHIHSSHPVVAGHNTHTINNVTPSKKDETSLHELEEALSSDRRSFTYI